MLLVSPARRLALAIVVLVLTTVKDIAISPLWLLLVAAVVLVFVILAPFMMIELLIEITAASLLWRISAITRVVKWWLHLLAIVPGVTWPYLLLTL